MADPEAAWLPGTEVACRPPSFGGGVKLAAMAKCFILMFIICSHYVALTISADDIVVACGGFVKSDVEINYSLIEVRIKQEVFEANAT